MRVDFRPILNNAELRELQGGVIVEMYEKAKYGRVRRAYLAEFDESERRRIGELYRMFYDWYMRRGIPNERRFVVGTVGLIRRAVNFFGGV